MRNAPGSSWPTATTRIQQVTDITGQGYIDINPLNGLSGLAFGSAGTDYLRLAYGGNVGIGTPDPGGRLTIVGGGIASSGRSGNPTYHGSLVIDEYSTTLNANMGIEFQTRGDSGGSGWRISSLANNTDLVFESRSGPMWFEKLRFSNGGNVGIGTNNPLYPVVVNGTIQA